MLRGRNKTMPSEQLAQCLAYKKHKLKAGHGDFSGDSVVENLPSDTGDVGSIAGWRAKIPRAWEQLKPTCCNSRRLCASATEPACSGAHALQREKPVHHSEAKTEKQRKQLAMITIPNKSTD